MYEEAASAALVRGSVYGDAVCTVVAVGAVLLDAVARDVALAAEADCSVSVAGGDHGVRK